MNNLKKLSLELPSNVNNNQKEKLILNIKHNISKESFEQSLKNYIFDVENYIGFDLDSLDYYEKWLGN